MARGEAAPQEDDLRYWLALTVVKDIGPMTAKRLLSSLASPRKVFEATVRDLMAVETVTESKARSIARFNEWKKVDRELAAIERKGGALLRYTDKGYPDALRHIEDSPILLYTKGSLAEHDKCAIAIVGSRMMTDYGRMMADTLAFDLASRGIRPTACGHNKSQLW